MILYILVLIILFLYEIRQIYKHKGYYDLKGRLVNVPKNRAFSFLRLLSIALSMRFLYPKYSVALILSILIIYLIATVLAANLLYFIRTGDKKALISALAIALLTVIIGFVIILLLDVIIQHISVYLDGVDN